MQNTFIGFVAFDEDEDLLGTCGFLARAGVERRSRSCDDLSFRRARIEPLELRPLDLPRRRSATAPSMEIAATTTSGAIEADAAYHGTRPSKSWADIVRSSSTRAVTGSAGAKVLDGNSTPPSEGDSTSPSEVDSTLPAGAVRGRPAGTPRSALSNRSTSTRPRKTLRWADDQSTCSTTSQPSPSGSDDDTDPMPCESWTSARHQPVCGRGSGGGGNVKEEAFAMQGSISNMEDSELIKYILANPSIVAQLRQQMRDCSPGETPTDVGSLKQFCRNWVNMGK